MARSSASGNLKGAAGAAVAIIIVIVAVVAVFLLFPNIIPPQAQPLGVGPGTAGVVITSFAATPALTDGGEEVSFVLTVQNKGGTNTDQTDIGGDIEYDIFGLSDWESESEEESGSDHLEKEDASRQLVGETTIQEWSAEAPLKNTDITYPVTARVDYPYRTEADVVLTLYGRDNPNVKGRGVTQSGIGQISVTGGPLSVVPKGTIPLIGSKKEFTMSFDISNIGGGRTYTKNRGSDLDKIIIDSDDCDISQDEVRLINNVRTITCRVTTSIDETDEQETKTVHLDIEYRYIVESTTNVRVLKNPE
jgi:hypothetical protein